MIYIQAICQTLTSVGPYYMINTYNWVKCAVWDAPKRLILDIELDIMMIVRDLSIREKEVNSSDSE